MRFPLRAQPGAGVRLRHHLGQAGLGVAGLPSRRVDVGGQTGVEVLCGAQLGGPVGPDLLEGGAERLPANGTVGLAVQGGRSSRRQPGLLPGVSSGLQLAGQAGQALTRFAGAGSSHRHGSLVGRRRSGRDRAPGQGGRGPGRQRQRLQLALGPGETGFRLLQVSQPAGGRRQRVQFGFMLGDQLVDGVELTAGAASLDHQGVVLLPTPVQLGQLGRDRLFGLLGGLGGSLLGVGPGRGRRRPGLDVGGLHPSARRGRRASPAGGRGRWRLGGSRGGRRLGPRRGG